MSNVISAAEQLKAEIQAGQQAYEKALEEKKQKLKELHALEAKQARADKAAAKAAKALRPAHERWVLDYMATHPEPIEYKALAKIAIATGAPFPLNKAGKIEELSVGKKINEILGWESRQWKPNLPCIRVIKSGIFQWNELVSPATYVQQPEQQPLLLNTAPAPTVNTALGSAPERKTVSIKGTTPAPKEASNEAYGVAMQRALPKYKALLASKGFVVGTYDFLKLWRDECIDFDNIRFLHKEPVFHHFFFGLCGINGPLECWQKEGGQPGTEIYQKAGDPKPKGATGEGWSLVTPAVPELPSNGSSKPSWATNTGLRA